MKRPTVLLVLLALLLVATTSTLVAAQPGPIEPLNPPPSAETGAMTDETPQLWLVEMPSNPTVDGTRLGVTKREKRAFRAEAIRAGLKYQERYAFHTLWNGLSIAISPAELGKLARMRSVKAIYPVETIQIPETDLISPEMATALAMTGADIAQSELGYTGHGIKVAVMDTGIDYDHPDLGGCFGPGCRVAYGYDFVGDDFNADPGSPSYNPVPDPDPDPDDCGGHGTHVAGIVGADGTVVGVAPDVTFGAYRVFGCEGSTTSDIMIAAMERALADDMDILNMSIGSAFQWPQYPTAQASDRLVRLGMVVVASIGNSGANGLYSAGAPGLGEDVIGVASFDNTNYQLKTFIINPDGSSIGYAPAAAAPLPPTSGTYPMARTGTSSTADDACASLPASSLDGMVALIRRGGCAFHIKSLNAQNAGAVAVVLYNNVSGRFSPTVAGDPPITIPVVAISDTEGELIDGLLASGQVSLTWTEEYGTFLNPTGGLISSFSSYGLSPDLALKPDIGAPGGLIFSTYPLEQGGYATLSGTSMASPHVAGSVALLLQAHPQTKAWEVRDILQNSADPQLWWGNPGLGFLDNVHRQGAGMLDIDDAILATTVLTPGKIAAGESEAGPYMTKLQIRNNGPLPITYDLSYVNALSTGGIITPSFFLSDASVSFSRDTVRVPRRGTANVWVTISPPTFPATGQYGGYITLTPQGEGQLFRVPFAGFVGDYQGIQVLAPTPFGFPWLANLSGGRYYNRPDGWTFTMEGADVAYFLVHFDHQPQLFTMEVFDADTGKSMFWAYQEEFLPRNSTSTGFFAFSWDGTTTPGKEGKKVFVLPDGDYMVEISVLKALGDKTNPDHWEKWTSPIVTIDRP